MLQKSSKHPPVDLFSSAGRHLDERRQSQLSDPNRWHIPFTNTYSVK